MQISGYGATQASNVQRAGQRRSSGFEQVVNAEMGQKDQVTVSTTGSPGQVGVLSASEKSFFNESFGMNVFGNESTKGSVVSSEGASVLNSQEISFFQKSFSAEQSSATYTRGGSYGQDQLGNMLNANV